MHDTAKLLGLMINTSKRIMNIWLPLKSKVFDQFTTSTLRRSMKVWKSEAELSRQHAERFGDRNGLKMKQCYKTSHTWSVVKVILITDTHGRRVPNPMPVCVLVKVLLITDTQGRIVCMWVKILHTAELLTRHIADTQSRIVSNPRTVYMLVKVLLTNGCLSGQPAGPTRGTTYRL